jgi:hypothetical protein
MWRLAGLSGNEGAVEDTWVSRDLPVLEAAVALLEDLGALPEVADIAERTGIAVEDVARALKAMDGVYVDLQMTMGDSARWFVRGVTPEARRAVGQWPTGESLVAELVKGLDAAAEREADPERKSRMRQAAAVVGGTARDVVVDVAAKVVERSMGLG